MKRSSRTDFRRFFSVSIFKLSPALILILLCSITLAACDTSSALPGSPASTSDLHAELKAVAKADGPTRGELPDGFPEEQDLAILIPMEAEPPLRANLETRDGSVLLPERWVQKVSEAYLDTSVLNAVEVENWYEDWRVVSVRIAPCSPLGHFPGHVPGGACWPQVRVVWEPVLEDHVTLNFGRVDRYADDRAIHALYRVAPVPEATENSRAMEVVLQQIADGLPLEDLHDSTLRDFVHERNHALMRLTTDAAALRQKNTNTRLYNGVGVRAEYEMEDVSPFEFQDRLREFLFNYAQPWALHELTSFSLPEGRTPVLTNLWTFVAFDGHDGVITQKDITVQSRETGRLLVHLGTDQTVGAQGEDAPVVAAANDPRVAEELAEHVFFRNSDFRNIGDAIIDPNQTFVQNTTCATCHRLTDNPFDFHTFSYFEAREATISPRVIADVENDLEILRAFLDTWPH